MITVEEARGLYQGDDAAHDFDHVLRVLKLAERIGVAEGADMDVLEAAVLLHDIGRSAEDRGGRCHSEAGAEMAKQVLAGNPEEKVDAVASAIASHRFRKQVPPGALEARILYDADKLDAIGAIGVARAYAVAGRAGQALWAKVPQAYCARDLMDSRGDIHDQSHTPVHEFIFKLNRLRDTLYTATARSIADERHRFMVQFFDRLSREVQGQA